MSSRMLFLALQQAATIARASGGGPRVRRLLAEIDLLRAAVASEADAESLTALVIAVRDEAFDLDRDVRLAREATAQMMD